MRACPSSVPSQSKIFSLFHFKICLSDFPFAFSVSREAEAIEMAHPKPSKEMSFIFPFFGILRRCARDRRKLRLRRLPKYRRRRFSACLRDFYRGLL